jgi:hypothetical protein
MNRFTARINVSSLLVATMSVCACLLLLDSQAFAQTVATATSSEGQSRQYAGINLLPVADVVVNHILKAPEVDQSAGFEFLIEGDRDAAGVLSNVTITQTSGDAKLKTAVGDLVGALSNSSLLKLLSEAKHVSLKIASNNGNVAGSATYKSQSADHASMMAHGYDAMIYSYGLSRRDYEAIYKALKASAKGDEVTIAFSMPRETFCALLSKYLSGN